MSAGLPTVNQFVALAASLQTETVERLVQPGSTTLLENAYFDLLGQVVKRAGSELLSASNQATIPTGGTLPHVWRLATLNGALARFNVAPVPMHLWSGASSRWLRPAGDDGGLISYRKGPMTATTFPVMADVAAGGQVWSPDVAYGNGYAIVCYEHSPGSAAASVKIDIVDLTTQATVRSFSTPSGCFRPRPFVVGDIVVVAYVNTNSHKINIDSYDLTTLTSVASQALSSCDDTTVLDIRAGGLGTVPTATDVTLLFTYDSGFGSDPYVTRVDTTDLTDFETSVAASLTLTVQPDLALGWLQDFGASGKFAIISADTVNGLTVLWDLGTPAFGTTNAAATHVLDAGMTTTPPGGLRNVIGSTTSSSSSGLYRVLYEIADLNSNSLVTIKTACWSGSVTTATVLRSVGLRSKLWKKETDLYFLTAFDSPEQKTYFVNSVGYDLTPSSVSTAPQAVAYVRSGSGLSEKRNTPSQVAILPDGYLIAASYESRTESIDSSGTAIGATLDERAIGLVEVTHREPLDTELGVPCEFAGNIFTAGAALGAFDGRTYGLPGFAYYPPDPTVDLGSAGGNLEASSTYVYRVLYSFLDHRGRKWRSAPSTPVSMDTDGSNFQFDLTLETLRLVDRGNSTAPGYQIEVYRTEADAPGAYFLVASIANDPTQDTIDLTDNVADVDLGEELYTDGNGLENQLLPAISHVVQFQNRLFVAEAGTGTLWYSLDLDLNHGLLFNEALTKDVGNPSEPITGLGVTGNTLIVFKANAIYAVFGDGANALGQGATYTDRLVDPGGGCTNAASILAPDDGVWYKANSKRAGFHRVTPGLTVEYVGQGVRKYNDLFVSSAVWVPHKSEYRFYTDEGTTLVYNTVTSTWSTNTDQPCFSAVSTFADVEGVVYAHATDYTILGEDAESFAEGDVSYTHKIRSPWLSFAGMEGWERIKRVLGVGGPAVLGDDVAAHRLTVRFYRDFDDSDLIGEYFKDFDGTTTKWEWSHRPKIQKLTSLMIELEVEAYQPPDVSVAPDEGDTFNGSGEWTFVNGNFTEADVGGVVVVTGGDYAGTYTISALGDFNIITQKYDSPVMTPDPGPSGDVLATTIVLTPPPLSTVGPGISGVTLTVGVKRGTKKLPASAHLTPNP